MRTKKLLIALLAVLSIWSCSEDVTDYTVILKESGKLKVEFLQNNIPVSGTMVYLIPEMNYDKGNSYIEYAIDYKETNEDGFVDFGEVNAGNYIIITEGVVVGSLTYNPERIVQVISGEEKTYSIEVLDYSGDISIYVYSYNYDLYEYDALQGIHVAMVTDEIMYNTASVEEAIDQAYSDKTTNTDGIAEFNLPSGYYYYAIAYLIDEYGDIYYEVEDITYLSTGEEYYDEIYFGDYK